MDLEELSLEFYKEGEFKKHELLKLDVTMSGDEAIQAMVTYRINAPTQQARMVEERLKDIL